MRYVRAREFDFGIQIIQKLATDHEVQLVNYLNATGIEIGLLVNFGLEKVDVKRKYRKGV